MVNEFANPLAMTFDYGQTHSREIESAGVLSKYFGVDCIVLNITDSMRGLGVQSALLCSSPDTRASVIVPGRNTIFLALAGAVAVAEKIRTIAFAANKDDREFFPDCRFEYIDAMAKVLQLFDNFKVDLLAPFVNKTKRDIVELGVKHGVPFNLTWTCYAGRKKACGSCRSCVGRLQAFESLGLKDPLQYEHL